jgi:transposase
MQKYTHKYPSDITRDEFEIVRSDLEGARKATKPREIDLYDIFCGILYLIKGGIQWRMLPSDFPKYGIVRYYYDVWSKKREDGTTLLSEVLKKISDNNKKR